MKNMKGMKREFSELSNRVIAYYDDLREGPSDEFPSVASVASCEEHEDAQQELTEGTEWVARREILRGREIIVRGSALAPHQR